MLVQRLKRILGPTAMALIASCLIWLMLLELYLWALSSAGIELKDYLQPPYKEHIDDYDRGSRNQTFDNMGIAMQLYKKVRVHCLLHLTNEHERHKSKHILKTWGRRCNRMHLSKSSNLELAYRLIYDMYAVDLDWLLHVHVDSYVIMENLRHKLSSYAPASKIYFSAFHLAYPYAHVSLRNSTDYIYSRGALQELLAHDCLSTNLERCHAGMEEGPNEQLYPFQVPAELLPFTLRTEFWFWPFIHRAVYSEQGFNATLVDYAIAIPYVSVNAQYVLEYLLYHLRPYGYMSKMPAMPPGSAFELTALPENNSLATQLYQQVRILCLVLTYPEKYEEAAKTIQQTWGRRCNKLILFSSLQQRTHNDWGVPTVALNVSEGYYYLWGKTKAAFKYVYRNHLDEADWFFKCDDDTYAIMENMRFMLHSHHPDEAIYFGCKFNKDIEQGYMSGGAGYVLSREAVRRLVKDGFDTGLCEQNNIGYEDFEMGVCLTKCNVTAGDSRDKDGRHRFMPLSIKQMMTPWRLEKDFWMYEYMYYKVKEGLECCSTYAISFHYIWHYQMHILDYLLYKMRPYGIINGHEPLTGNTVIHNLK